MKGQGVRIGIALPAYAGATDVSAALFGKGGFGLATGGALLMGLFYHAGNTSQVGPSKQIC